MIVPSPYTLYMYILRVLFDDSEILQIPDQDLEARRTGQRIDPVTNKIISCESNRQSPKEENSEEELEQDDEEDGAEPLQGSETDKRDFFGEDLVLSHDYVCTCTYCVNICVQVKIDTYMSTIMDESISEALSSRLVQRSIDLESAMQKHINDYKEKMLTKIEVPHGIQTVSVKYSA